MVSSCPYIDNKLLQVSLAVLTDVENHFLRRSGTTHFLKPGSVLRIAGRYENDDGSDEETEPVTFLSSPYLLLQDKLNVTGKEQPHRMMTLLQSLYGYDIEGERESTQVINKLASLQRLKTTFGNKKLLHVPQLWCLLVGTGLLITFSELSIDGLRGDLIEIRNRDAKFKEPYRICIIGEMGGEHITTVERGCSYVVCSIHISSSIGHLSLTKHHIGLSKNCCCSGKRSTLNIKRNGSH
jgi:hypothetical protein